KRPSSSAAASTEDRPASIADLRGAVHDRAVRRIRPVIMTVTAIVADLAPIKFGHGTGDEIMRRIAAPMIGGMISATVLALLVVPAVNYLWQKRSIR
ncbi:MAG: efflux RND transporter permease subunit, partial [Salinisphaera sp.]|nr:efflux RND transporter permease subunit [Salinisphaera sp.]